MILYENKNYKVEVNEDGTGYSVVHRISNVTEASEQILPKAITSADVWNTAINNATKEVTNVVSIGQPR